MKARTPSILPVIVIAALAGGLSLLFLFSLRADSSVVVAARTIAVGARLTANDLTIKQVRSADALPNALKAIDAAVGQVISVQRLAGDQVTSDMLGSQALSAIASGLAADHRAVAVTVSRSAGLAGIVRPGDLVTLIAVVEPPTNGQTGLFGQSPVVGPGATATAAASLSATSAAGFPNSAAGEPGLPSLLATAAATPLPTAIKPYTPFARVTASGLKVLLVPQTFRYEEATTTDSQGFAAVQSSQVGQSEGVILLDVPATPVTLSGPDGPTTLTLPELIALLDTKAKVYLALEPPAGATGEARGPGVAIEQLVNLGVGGQP